MKDTPTTTTRRPSLPRLLARRACVPQTLPPLEEVLRGSLLHRRIRCGKATCHCATGRGHALTCVTVTFAKGRTQQVTVPPAWRPTVRRWLANYRRYWQAIEAVSAINRRLLQLREMPASRARGRSTRRPASGGRRRTGPRR